VYIYYLVVNNTAVDYNAFWCNGLDADSLTLLQKRGDAKTYPHDYVAYSRGHSGGIHSQVGRVDG
jgi:hypothetical protein